MRSLRRVLLSRWVVGFAGVLLLALLVWFFGPLLRLESVVLRAAVILLVLLVWAFANLFLDFRRRRTDRALADGVAAISPKDVARAEETANLREKLQTALTLLRKASGSRGYLYEQPWYVIIGPPGAGKTTALLNAGLKFPLAAEMGQGAVAGVGGTRLCDWWFTEQAVLIDTAGRYTTQDSDAAVDRAGWEGFLDLLRRTRPRQPLNGVLVAIGLSDLLQAPPAERQAHARAIRRRIKELTERLRVRLPVYALFTKADLLAGFSEYFDDLDRSGRDQVWGHSFSLAEGANLSGPVAGWGEALRALVGRLNGRLLDRLQAERSPGRRALLAGFPAQLVSLELTLGEFLAEAFGGSRLDPAPFLRGVYFTSGTQEGTPIDRLTGTLARSFGVDQMRVPSLRPQQGRSYFLGGLLRLVFNEAMLGGSRSGARRRRALIRTVGFAAIGVLTLAVVGAWLASWMSQRQEAARLADALAHYEQLVHAQNLDPISDADLRKVAPILDAAAGLAQAEAGRTSGFGFGLSQAGKYAEETQLLYRHALERVLLPRMVLRLENQMRAMLPTPQQPELLFQSVRVYLMLCGRQRMDRELVRQWEAADWQSLYPDLSAGLQAHLQALLRIDPLPEIAPDAALVAGATRALPPNILALEAYARIRASPEAQALPEWTPASVLGGSDARIFVRASGKPLTAGVDGFFTPGGFQTVFLPQLVQAVAAVTHENWLPEGSNTAGAGGVAGLPGDVTRLYTDDYAHAWDAMLLDLRLQPLGRGAEAVQKLYVLAPPGSMLHDLLVSIVQQLDLSRPAAANGVLDRLKRATGTPVAKLAAAAGRVPDPGKAIDDYYAPLRDWVGSGPGSQLDITTRILGDLRAQLAAAPVAGAGGATPSFATSGDAAHLLLQEASQAPAPVAGWLRVIATGSSATEADNLKAGAQAAFNAAGGAGALCRTAVPGSYPFKRNATKDIALGDFIRLFAPGGAFDSFFKAQIAPFVVDANAPAWRLQPVNGVSPPVTGADLAQFQRAARIREVFFPDGLQSPSVHVAIVPESLDARTRQATLDLGGITIAYAHQPLPVTHITWPSPQGIEDARLTFDPPPAGGAASIATEGPWAMFRLADHGVLHRGGTPGQYVLSFRAGDRTVEYQLRVDPALNPFNPGLLGDFRCPSLR